MSADSCNTVYMQTIFHICGMFPLPLMPAMFFETCSSKWKHVILVLYHIEHLNFKNLKLTPSEKQLLQLPIIDVFSTNKAIKVTSIVSFIAQT